MEVLFSFLFFFLILQILVFKHLFVGICVCTYLNFLTVGRIKNQVWAFHTLHVQITISFQMQQHFRHQGICQGENFNKTQAKFQRHYFITFDEPQYFEIQTTIGQNTDISLQKLHTVMSQKATVFLGILHEVLHIFIKMWYFNKSDMLETKTPNGCYSTKLFDRTTEFHRLKKIHTIF